MYKLIRLTLSINHNVLSPKHVLHLSTVYACINNNKNKKGIKKKKIPPKILRNKF